ncbi:MAG: hypothetical protein AABW56_01925 [Nanoarchaeota archaeon]
MTDKLPFETYKSVAKEIAERTGNLTLANIIMKTYLDIAQTYSFYPISPNEKLKVVEVYKELEQIALEHNKMVEKAGLKMQEILEQN